MNLRDGLPSGFEVGNLTIRVRTGAAFWMWVASKMADLDDKDGIALLEQAIESLEREGSEIHPLSLTPDEARSVFERLSWFMRGGVDEPKQAQGGAKKTERLLGYEKDIDAIYAAFLQSYGVDLYSQANGKPLVETLHWWRFLALANNLPAGSMLVDYYMHYRGVDVSKLPRKTAADKKYLQSVIDIKRRVSLEQEKRERKKVEPKYIQRARELKERSEAAND